MLFFALFSHRERTKFCHSWGVIKQYYFVELRMLSLMQWFHLKAKGFIRIQLSLILLVLSLVCRMVTREMTEGVDLNNRSRSYKPSGIETVPLPVHHRSSINDVGNVMLVAFGSKTPQGSYQAVCEDILLWSNSGQTEQIQSGKHVNT